ncbi:hypothetical protein [Streptomyces sp. ME19-01-6]|uniref:hypothetical protein n=1 Tax=Streptomyces sp. ME19-01-6 TaxID=3028686 RepID=UPI0029BC1FBB|nr:hypothetical protein [Streptomyces sp. ME19-01-6]MDX3233388.1 hypothetical protein [Streptomyces sp. ME19-01-6]
MTDTEYPELLAALDEFAEGLDPRERVTGLYGLIAPLLGLIEREDRELSDEPVMSNPEAVLGLRRAAAGEPVDADAIHEHLTTVGLAYSEDQDPDFHVISQTAYVAAAWLTLLAGRGLRSDGYLEDGEDLLPEFAPSTFTQIADLLAWTRSDQMYTIWEDAAEDPDLGDLPAATRELKAMYQELTT